MSLTRLEQGSRTLITHPRDNPDKESRAYYSLYYKTTTRNGKNTYKDNKDDSPDKSRASLIQRVYPYISSLPEGSYVLDLGAGRQIFEKEYEDKYGNKPICHIITVDIADIPKDRLLAKGYAHVQATGQSLPFHDEQFDAVISNMAFDFMVPVPQATTELYRITKDDASVFLNLHHPSLVNYDIDARLRKRERQIACKALAGGRISDQKILQLATSRYHKYLRDYKLLFATEGEIQSFFGEFGFDIKEIKIKSDLANKWWEVDLVRKNVPIR